MFKQAKISSPDDLVVLECEVTNMSDVGMIYPDVLFYGSNFDIDPDKEGSPLILPKALLGDAILNRAYVDHAFVRYNLSLFPDETFKFAFKVIPGELDCDNDFGFIMFSKNSSFRSTYDNTYPDPVVDKPTDPDPDPDVPVGTLGSPGGGCDMGIGRLALIVFAGIGLCVRKK